MSEIVKKIAKSRQVLHELLSKEYDTSSLQLYSQNELDKLYSIQVERTDPFIALGNAISCNFSVNHKLLDSVKLHVFYYNFPEYNSTKSTKFNKSVIQKIIDLYDSDTIKPFDNIILIINEKITESYETIMNNLNESLKLYDFKLLNKMLKKTNLESRHFRTGFLFDIDSLQVNLLEHDLVPKHEVVRSSEEIENILKKCNCQLNELPIIKQNDSIARLILCVSGDICKITRKNLTSGYYEYYRLCR
tara:strand:- start:387 stop:1127 length:741 start_codon:yes stop_codon:yes gene_type:complete